MYKKTVPNIRSDARDKFWEEQQVLVMLLLQQANAFYCEKSELTMINLHS